MDLMYRIKMIVNTKPVLHYHILYVIIWSLEDLPQQVIDTLKIEKLIAPLYRIKHPYPTQKQEEILNSLHKLGISISYKHVSKVENSLGSSICKRFEDEGIICPSQLWKSLFTVGALDNIDYNLSSTIAQEFFHGTGISIFEFLTMSNYGICRIP